MMVDGFIRPADKSIHHAAESVAARASFGDNSKERRYGATARPVPR
jgi:hypothetical protein